ncbi:MAG: hypothetical protein JSS49_02080 [Planctomycetes bacterium]|nr:hypothetical protein [Planctomycetota bacterium]
MAEDNKAWDGPKPPAFWQDVRTFDELPSEHQKAFVLFDKQFVRKVCLTLGEVFPEVIGEVPTPSTTDETGKPGVQG